jgi:3-oxoadipate enol-lactonase
MLPPYEEHGTGSPIVLLHAFPLSRTMWSANTKALTDAGFRVILPDLRGFGEHESHAETNLMDDMATDVAELLDKLGIEQAIIGGLSMGGYVTFALYRMFPERFAAVLLFDTMAAADTEEKRTKRFEVIEKVTVNGSIALVENFLPNLTGDLTKANNPGLIKDLEERVLSVSPEAASAALRGMADRPDSTGLLGKIGVPACLIFGEDDKITNLQAAESMKGAIRDSKLYVLKDSGHLSNMEQPAQFNAALINFVAGLNP